MAFKALNILAVQVALNGATFSLSLLLKIRLHTVYGACGY